MRTHRFGRKLKLPSTFAIKHQIRKLMFEDAVKKAEAEAEAGAEAIRGQLAPNATSCWPGRGATRCRSCLAPTARRCYSAPRSEMVFVHRSRGVVRVQEVWFDRARAQSEAGAL